MRASPTSTAKTDWTDADMLAALDMRAAGMTTPAIGRALGRSKSAVIGCLDRVNRDTDASERA